MKQTSVRQIFQQFPTDDACIGHLFNVRFDQGHICPKCECEAKWYRPSNEQAYSYQWCGHHIHPMVSDKELQRQLGVIYQDCMARGCFDPRTLAVIDGEAAIGGKARSLRLTKPTVIASRKAMAVNGAGTAVVMGMLERDGDVMAKVIQKQHASGLMPPLRANVLRANVCCVPM